GSSTNPYVQRTVNKNSLKSDDINPVPAGGCASLTASGNGSANANGNNGNAGASANTDHKITICHATGSATNPYVEITVDEHALKEGHTLAKGDIIPAPLGGCPTTLAANVSGTVNICVATGNAATPYVLTTVDLNSL